MAYLLHSLRKGKRSAKGQGLVEYALILALVSVVVIGVTAVFGQEIRAQFCKAALALDPTLDPPGCDSLDVDCVVTGTPPGNIRWEAVVNDTAGENNVTRVQFYVDGHLRTTEIAARYCFNGGDTACNPYNSSQLGSGSHELIAIAYDADGNIGRCTYTLNVP